MISYSRGGMYHFYNVFQISGSVFPRSFLVALPCAIFAGVLRFMIDNVDAFEFLQESDSILSNNQVFSGFNFLMGFLIVFRTSEAHARFWEGATANHRMRAEWFDAASAVCAFCHHSKVAEAKLDHFKQLLARLFSYLHSAALAELDSNSHGKEADDMRGFQYAVLDPQGLDEDSLHALRQSQYRAELIFGWIQGLIVTQIETGVLSIPPPILSRVFQELSNGMVAFHEARMIGMVPFPFPYAQTCDCLLLMHWILVPFVTTQWVKSVPWCAIFVFVQVFILWTLNFIAVEIEDPFGDDANDLDGSFSQEDFNLQLKLLLETGSSRIPTLSNKAGSPLRISASLSDTWSKLGNSCSRDGLQIESLSKSDAVDDANDRTRVGASLSDTWSKLGSNSSHDEHQNESLSKGNVVKDTNDNEDVPFTGTKVETCPNFTIGHHRAAEAGTYSNDEGERGAAIRAGSYKTSLCQDFLRGSCELGDDCIYAHGEEQLRQGSFSRHTPLQSQRGEGDEAPLSSRIPVTPSSVGTPPEPEHGCIR